MFSMLRAGHACCRRYVDILDLHCIGLVSRRDGAVAIGVAIDGRERDRVQLMLVVADVVDAVRQLDCKCFRSQVIDCRQEWVNHVLAFHCFSG